MIRNAVIHVNNEQPLLADLLELPAPSDASLVCTNLRMLNGKRPVFADRIESTFVFPLVHIRFVEIPPGARGELVPVSGDELPAAEPEREAEAELELDEDFLRRIRDI